MGYTEKQRLAITSRGGNLLVSASAGSGKTTVMIERIVSLLSEGASLDNMLICTFTRASAADMRDKLAQKLSERAAAGDERAEKQLVKLPTAEISTLHSWCQRLIRNYFYELGVDPAFEILEEKDAEVALFEAIDEAISTRSLAADTEFAEFYEAMRGKSNDNALRALIREVYEFATVQESPEEFLRSTAYDGLNRPELALAVADSEYGRMLRRYEGEITALISECAMCGFKKGYERFTALWNALRSKNGELPNWVGGSKKGFDELNDRAKRLFDRVKESAVRLLDFYDLPDADSGGFTRVLVGLVEQTAELYAAEKRRRARLDYADLEHLCARLLDNGQVLSEVCEKYRYIFVDEYQDINPLQESILARLGGNKFLVGDIKQSIYAFRMCDPGIFLDKYANYESRGYLKPIELNDNFRSNKGILDFTNLVMQGLMTENFGKINYRRDAMLVCGNGKTEGEVVLKTVVTDRRQGCHDGVYSVLNGGDAAMDGAEAEANLVVRDICERLASTDANGNPVRKSDIAVLSSARSELTRLIYRKLRSLGVEVSVSDRDRFASVYEVSVLCEFMKHLADYTDDISLVAVLRSPLVGLSDGELAEIKLASDYPEKRFHILCRRYAKTHTDGIAERLNAFYALRERYRMMSKTHSAGETVGELVAEKKWFALTFAGEDGRVNADALNAFLMHLNTSPYAKSVGEFVEYLKRDNADFTPPPTVDAVKIMTIHAAKGLEFRFVYLVDTSHGFNFQDLGKRVLCERELGVCMKNFDIEGRTVHANRLTAAAAMLERRKLLEERMRLLYVALTRAQESMYIYARVKPTDELFSGEQITADYESGRCFFDWIRPVVPFCRREVYYDTDCVMINRSVARQNDAPVDEDIALAIRRYLERGESYERRAYAVKSSVTALMEEQHDEQPHPAYYATGADDDRAIRSGNAYHKAMELIDFYADFDGEWERIRSVGEIEALVDKERLRVAAARVGELCKNMRLYREKQFILSEGGRLIQGVIDLLAVCGDECFVIDYKTSRPERIESGCYDLQLSVYAYAARKILGLKVKKAAIYGFERGEFTFSTLSDRNPLGEE